MDVTDRLPESKSSAMTEVAAATAGVGPEHRWLTVAWPLAVVFHLLANSAYLVALFTGVPTVVGVLQLMMAALAVLVLMQPRSAYVAALGLLFVVVAVLKAPFIGNHEVILALCALTVLLAVLGSGGRWPGTALPVLRWVLIIAYASIALSKLNASFFDPAVSCAVVFGDEFSRWLGFRVSDVRSLSVAAIWTTAVVELAIPVLLVVRRWRVAGLVLAMMFHYVLALEPVGHVFDFTATLFPLFLAFAPAEVQTLVSDRIDGLAGGRGRAGLALGVGAVLLAHGVVMVAGWPIWVVAYPAWLLVGTSVLWWVLTAVVGRGRNGAGWRGEGVQARGPIPMLVPIVAILVANAVAPYLQIRTAAAFNMYSNLETVYVDGDHYLFSAVGGVRSSEMLLIVDTPDDHPLAYYRDGGRAVAADNLRRYQRNRLVDSSDPEALAADDEVRLRWLVSDAVDPPDRLSDLDPGPGGWGELLAHKFGFVRAVDVSQPARCLRSWGPVG